MPANEIPERDDRAFEQALHGAYDQMDPTPEAEARMLAALKAARAAKIADEVTPIEVKPIEKQGRKRIAPWKVALPAAACLALAAIGVGVFMNAPEPNAMPTPSISTETDTSGATNDAPAMSAEKAAESEEATMGAYDTTESGTYDTDEDWNTEEYNAVEETGFVSTATSPLSTVSADVDTASYANLRRMLADGCALSDIPTGAVRIEEMLNYFHYNYATPTGDERFAISAKTGPCPWNPNTQLLVLGFATPQEVQDKPANLVFLIDVSGSMDYPDKLGLLQDSFATLLEHLDGDDRVSIVTYSGHEEVVLEGAKGDDDKAIMRAIYRLRADGSTNGEAGLKMAYEVAERNKIEGGVNRIVMASDGDLRQANPTCTISWTRSARAAST